MPFIYDWYFDKYLDTYGLVSPYQDIYTDLYTDTYGVIPAPPAVTPSVGTAGGAIQDSRPYTGFGAITGIPDAGARLEVPRGRGYAGPWPDRAEDLEHDWHDEGQAPAPDPGPSIAELAHDEAARIGRGLAGLGRILAPEPYVRRPQATRCRGERLVGGRLLRCGRAPHTGGMHYADGLYWR